MLRWRKVAGSLRVAWLIQAATLLLALPVAAQVRFGDFSNNLSGTVSLGFSEDSGNVAGSDHEWTLGGNAILSGSFYNPNFLSYNASVYLNQSRANSDYQSISDASGFDLSSTIFGGSRFPGSISYSKAFNSEGNYAVPGLANYVTHGNSSTFGVNWSASLPDAPSLTASFILGNSQYSVYGASDTGNNAFHSLNLHSGYQAAGFNMNANYTLGGGHSLIPEVVSGQQNTETNQTNSNYGFNLSHRFPFQGSVTAGINRSTWSTDYLGSTSTETVDLVNAFASAHPTEKLYCSASANYSDNLSGELVASVAGPGGGAAGLNTNQSSNSLDLLANANYTVSHDLQTSAFTEYRSQLFLGENYGVNSYGGSANYAHRVYDGNFNASLSITANRANQAGEDNLGISTNENYSSIMRGWRVNGSFGYAQNVQTLLITYMNSYFNYSGSTSRNWGKMRFSASAGASRTGLTDEPGTVSSTQSYDTTLGYGRFLTGTASYSRSTGQALETGAGLVTVPVPSPVLPSNLVSLYGGNGYSFSLSSTPIRGLIASASFAKSTSNTSTSGSASSNQNELINSLVQYQFRKLYFISGYSRLDQGFSDSGAPPEVVSSFYIGISRWFNFF